MGTATTSETFSAQIGDVIKKNLATYQNDPDRIISDYRGEKGLTEAYNGRQLLELLQNADDAGTDEVLINLDTKNKILSIANNGEAFDIKGVKSLMLANTSSKNKREFIGNKGLGFRSILNWVTKVSIKTKGTTLIFSPGIAKEKFEEIVPDAAKRSEMIASEKDLPKESVPFAVLAIPKVDPNNADESWVTVIEVEYKKEFEKDILKQIAEIRPEILLFLNHTETITIAGAGEQDKTLKLEKPVENGEQFLEVNGIRWQLYDSGEQELNAEAEKYYRFKIAWKSDLSDVNTRFFTYFPTQEPTRLPYLIHATFDLDQSRNHLNVSDDNTFILSQVAEMLGELAVTKLQTHGHSNWLAWQFLLASAQSANKIFSPFYARLAEFCSTLPLYPCIDGSYRTINDITFYNDEFSTWILNNGFAHLFPNLLLPVPPEMIVTGLKFKKYDEEKWYSKVNELSALITTVHLRADLIGLLMNDVFKPHNKKYALLLNKSGQFINNTETTVFTPIINSKDDFDQPTYLKFEFLNKSLYDELVTRHKNNFNTDQPSEARRFTEFFREIFYIQPYDSNAVIIRIIAGTRRELRENKTLPSSDIIKEMVQSVYKNYRSLKGDKETKENTVLFSETFPLLNRAGVETEADNLFLNASFPTGHITEDVYDGIFTDENYVQDIGYWGLGETEALDFQESFFIWMRVNRYAKLKIEESKDIYKNEGNAYRDYVLKKTRLKGQPTWVKYKVLKIENFNATLERLSIEKLIIILKKDAGIFSALSWNNPDEFQHRYGNAYYQGIAEKPSYISFQLDKLDKFKDLVIEDYDVPFIKSFSIENDNSLFKKYDIKEDDVKYLLSKLGAKATFLDFGIHKVFNLLNECAKGNSDPAIASRLYRLAFNNFRRRTNEIFETFHFDLMLLAVKNGKKEYRHVDDVYYSDNTTLPSKIINDYWMFYFPKRSGEKQVEKYFGVKTFKDISIKVVEGTVSESIGKIEFLKWVEKIKPYLLTYRLNGDSIEKSAALAIKNFSVQLISKAKYCVDNKDHKELLPGEFLNLGNNKFMICADHNSRLDNLKDTPAFCEAFAEIMCVLFEVNEGKDEYRAVFKDKADLKDTKYLIETKSLDEKLKLAIKLLGLSSEERAFWNTVFALSSVEAIEMSTSREALADALKQKSFKLPDYYGKVHFDSFDNKESVEFLKLVCDDFLLSLQQLKASLPDFPALKNWHINQINNKLIDVSSLYMKALWASLKDKEMDKQGKFSVQKEAFSAYCQHLTWDSLDAFVFDLDYMGILIANVEGQFNLSLAGASTIQPATVIYKSLMGQYNIEEAALSPADQSLLYFEGYTDYFINVFKNINQAEITDDSDDNALLEGLTDIKFPIITDGAVPAFKTGANGSNAPNNDHSKRSRQQKRAGKRAEFLTHDILKADYDIKWISANSDQADVIKNDAAGYDMEYKEKGTEEWFFLEVKSVSSHSFIISINEIRVALKERERYHLGLVKNGELNIIKDFFSDEERISKFNELLSYGAIRPTDFEVYFNLSPGVEVQQPVSIDALQN